MRIYLLKQIILILSLLILIGGTAWSEYQKQQSFLESRIHPTDRAAFNYERHIKNEGIEAVYKKPTSDFDSLNIYVVDKNENFVTKPLGRGDDFRQQEAETLAVVEALAGNTDTRVLTDYKGDEVLSSYRPIYVDGERYALVIEIATNDLLASQESWVTFLDEFLVGLGLVVAVGLVVWNVRNQRAEIKDAKTETTVGQFDVIEELADLKAINDGFAGMYVICDKSGQILYASKETAKILRIPHHEILDSNVDDISGMPPERHKQFRESLKSGQLANRVVETKRRDGKKIKIALGVSRIDTVNKTFITATGQLVGEDSTLT